MYYSVKISCGVLRNCIFSQFFAGFLGSKNGQKSENRKIPEIFQFWNFSGNFSFPEMKIGKSWNPDPGYWDFRFRSFKLLKKNPDFTLHSHENGIFRNFSGFPRNFQKISDFLRNLRSGPKSGARISDFRFRSSGNLDFPDFPKSGPKSGARISDFRFRDQNLKSGPKSEIGPQISKSGPKIWNPDLRFQNPGSRIFKIRSSKMENLELQNGNLELQNGKSGAPKWKFWGSKNWDFPKIWKFMNVKILISTKYFETFYKIIFPEYIFYKKYIFLL